jgi:DedD protein
MAKQITTDEEFKLQRQARHRLIGAVALMLAIVIFLPMVFDSEPDVNVGNIELRIPDKSEVQEFRSGTQASTVAEAPASAVPVAPAAVAVPVAKAPAPAVSASPKVTAAPVPPKPAAPVKAVTPAGWVLQVGAYSREDAAHQMLDNLKKRGFPAYIEKVNGMLRVRVGGYPSREAAEKTRQKLEAIGLHPNVISPE